MFRVALFLSLVGLVASAARAQSIPFCVEDGNELEAVADTADDDRLDDPVDPDRLGQLVERRLVHLDAGLSGVRDQPVQVHFERDAAGCGGRRRRRRRRLRRGLGNQGTQAAAQRGSFVCHVNL